jgi:hypothetical protein
VDRSLRRHGQLLVAVGAFLGALVGVVLALAVEDPQTSTAAVAPGRALTPDDPTPADTDFIGGAEALPAKPAPQGQNIPGSDFAGGTLPLTVRDGQGEIDKDRAA